MKLRLRNQVPSHKPSALCAMPRLPTRREPLAASAAIAALLFSVSCVSNWEPELVEATSSPEAVTAGAPVAESAESDVLLATGETVSNHEPPSAAASDAPSAAASDAPSAAASEAPGAASEAPGAASEAPSAASDEPPAAIEEPATAATEEPATAATEEPATASPPGGSTDVAEPEASTPPAGEPAPVEAPTLAARPTLQTAGRQLLDTCGNVFVTRGVEQIFGDQLPRGNDWLGLIEEISESGVNAVRILAGTDTLDTSDVDALLGVVRDSGMVAYITPYGDENTRWLERQAVRAMLAKHEKYIIIDAFGEPTFDDLERFLSESTDAIRRVRSWGYRVPLTVTANQYGRDLPSLFDLGPQIVAADPLGNTILGWQAYWGANGYYHERYGMSFDEAMDAISRAPFPIQLGLDRVTDYPSSETADFGALMSAAEAHGVGWLWWDWYNPYGNENDLSEDGSAASLTATGTTVMRSHPASAQKTAQPVCVR
jgi:hypothetical protein